MAVASQTPVGVICASYSGQLSRLYHWDTSSDTITPGQFLKGRSEIYDISPDGKYFAYYAESFHKPAKSYIAIAMPPYFTALAFFPTFHLGCRSAKFEGNDCLNLFTMEPGWWGERCSKENIVQPGCPFKINCVSMTMRSLGTDHVDLLNDRRVWIEDKTLMAQKNGFDKTTEIKTFFREPFVPIEPPDWAKEW